MSGLGEPNGERVNPARAGMIRWSRVAVSPWGSKPRASGDDPGPITPALGSYT